MQISFAILKTLHKDNKYEADHHEYMEEIFRRGYEKLYYECFDKLWTALPGEVAEQTIDILKCIEPCYGHLEKSQTHPILNG
ncbi:MAG: hypothetical protein IPL73_24115 [Candidatus Obscuribacter sp.]|nr:hypothetical protein [Candidatus Obscuribacter sp.]